ncbi:2-(3-amino-3-carboxypropyl)histidine synthase subunit 2 isoform X1 [Dermacentor albipictus]|uniref:2-(3-amino-3-carboxypropyl)histidine synthase subunit 2 isoform X1 n=1 Tax=Dermacentor albipictus TaxID=60249 RepID=UPI0038FCC1C6
MASAFSSSDQAAIDRTADVSADDVKPTVGCSELEFKYEVKRAIAWICENRFKKVALQFPDEMLVDSVNVTLALQASVLAELFILGDTSYGSCCVDEAAAEHILADAIIHFGHSCLSMPSRLPVLFVFGRSPCSLEGLLRGLQNVFPDPDARIVVLFDTQYDHCSCDIFTKISALFRNAICSELVIPSMQQELKDNSRGIKAITKCSRRIYLAEDTSLADYSVLFIGPENRTLTNIVLTFNNCACYSYNPSTRKTRQESLAVNQQLMRRYYLIEKAKDANIVGILVGTLGVKNYLSAIGHLKKLIRNAGKKPYTLVTGKLNVAKLANFQEVDVYVLVACPENTLLDSKEFFRPIVTPLELELALNPSRKWSQVFSASFNDILPGGELYLELTEQSSQPKHDVSLITGKIRSLGIEDNTKDEGSTAHGALVAKEATVAVPGLHIAAAGEYLMNRTWQGLETHLGQSPAATISKGQMGLAAGYVGEGTGGQAQM